MNPLSRLSMALVLVASAAPAQQPVPSPLAARPAAPPSSTQVPPSQAVPTQTSPTGTGVATTGQMSLSAAQSTALQQVSALRQAQLDEAIAAEDAHQAAAALLPRARSATTMSYN